MAIAFRFNGIVKYYSSQYTIMQSDCLADEQPGYANTRNGKRATLRDGSKIRIDYIGYQMHCNSA